jgi:hypothetical protein
MDALIAHLLRLPHLPRLLLGQLCTAAAGGAG